MKSKGDNVEAQLEYKCRRCGVVEHNLCASVTLADVLLAVVVINGVFAEVEHSGKVYMHALHNCKDGGMGVSDLQGYRVVRKGGAMNWTKEMLIVGLLAATAWSGETLEVRGALTNTLMVIPTSYAITNALTTMSTGSYRRIISAATLNEIRLAEGGRMSSPVESVTIVTNVTTASNESGCSICAANPPGVTPAVYHLGGLTGCQPYKPATEKTETTTVVEIKTLRFTWDGKEYVVKSERILSTKVRRWVRKDNWVEEP